jgi:DNA-binding transcriptional LysR family regulator
MNQELHSLAVFAVVIERGSFAAAARVLERAPSAVSTHISRLEEWFGAKLLHRTTRNLALTDAGERLLPEAQAILAAHRRADALRRTLDEAVGGPLRITAPTALLQDWVMPAVVRVVAEHPNVDVSVLASDRRDDLKGGDVDVALRVGRLSQLGLMARRVGTLREGRVERDGAPDRWIRLPWQVERAAESTMSVDSVIAARAAVDAGLGWALLPTEDGEVETPIYAAHGFGSRLPAQVSVLIEALAEQGRRLADR